MARISRFKLRDSDRDGFTRREIGMLKDGAWKVGPDEFDLPPLSKRSLGGQGDISASDALIANSFGITQITTIPAGYDNPITYVTAAGGITPSFVHPWMAVSGSLNNVTVTANPRIAAGVEGNRLTLVGAGSTITLPDGLGVALAGSATYVVALSSILCLVYTASNGAARWQETSRTVP